MDEELLAEQQRAEKEREQYAAKMQGLNQIAQNKAMGIKSVVHIDQCLCAACESITTPTKITPGSLLVNIVLFLFFVVPGIIYLVWRFSARKDGCARCGSVNLIPISTPRGLSYCQSKGITVSRK